MDKAEKTTDTRTNAQSAKLKLRKRTLIKRSIGRTVTFHGYDGRDYRATLTAYKNQVVSVQYYPVSAAGTPIPYICNAYLSDLSRITL